MNNGTEKNLALQQRFAEVFAHLPEQDIEQFYAHYQLWLLRRRVPIIQEQITALQAHLAENQRLIDSLRPSAVALAVLARLQSRGVSDVDLLDQMLERGEDWLDRMMQRLDYCEQVEDFIQGNYTQWCWNSLEGAYDWIDTMFSSTQEMETLQEPAGNEAEAQATEELLLQKLSQDEEETSEAALNQPAVTPELVEESTGAPAQQEAIEQEETPSKGAEQPLMAEAGAPIEIESTSLEAAETSEEVSGEPMARTAENAPEAEEIPGEPEAILESTETPIEAENALESAEAPAVVETLSETETLSTQSEAATEAQNELLPIEAVISEETEQSEVEAAENEERAALASSENEQAKGEVAQAVDEHMAIPEADVPDYAAEVTQAPAAEEVPAESAHEAGENALSSSETGVPLAESAEIPEAEAESEEVTLAAQPGKNKVEEAGKTRLDQEAEGGVQSAEIEEAGALVEPQEEEAKATAEIPGKTATSLESQEAASTYEVETPDYEIEKAEVAADDLNSEEEQRPWYEYLEADVQVGLLPANQTEEGSDLAVSAPAMPDNSTEGGGLEKQEYQKYRDATKNETEPAFYENAEVGDQLASAAENGDTQEHPVPINEGAAFTSNAILSQSDASETSDIVPSQLNANETPVAPLPDNDETLPMALRDIQRAQERSREEGAAESGLEAASAPASEAAASEVPETEQATPVLNEAGEDPAAEERAVGASETLEAAAVEGRGAPEESEPASQYQTTPASQSHQAVPATQVMRSEPQQPSGQSASAEKPKKRGFWQRLFGWMFR